MSRFCLFLFFLALPVSALAAGVHILPYQGAITPVAAEYLVDGIAYAEDAGAAAVLIELDTPGGLDSAMRTIVKAQLAAGLPVVVYVAPSGSRAASAGAYLTMAAHVAAMAPGTNIGSATPVHMGGAAMDSTMARKVIHDAVAYLESIAQQRGRNVEMARRFVEDAENLPAERAVEQNVVDLVASSRRELLQALDGRVVEVDGKPWTLETADAEVVVRPMSARQRLLKSLVDPQVAYILLLLGIYGLFFELSNPGALAPGIIGGICILLALFALQSLPTNTAGIALLLLGVILLILEVKVTSFGALTLGGLVAMVLGSLILFESPADWARVSLRVIIPSVLVFASFFLLCAWLVVRSQRRAVVTGAQALVGTQGRVLETIQPGDDGKAVFHGEVWNARSDEAIEAGASIEVLGIEGRVATVRRV
jgi:membrane-bound serine protease (ClpP class)